MDARESTDRQVGGDDALTIRVGAVALPLASVFGPIPLELFPFGVAATLHRIGEARLRDGAARSPDGGLIADYHGEVVDPSALAGVLSTTPGVIDHGLFEPEMVTDILIGRGEEVERIDL